MSIGRREFMQWAGAAAMAGAASLTVASEAKEIPYAAHQPKADASLRTRLDSSVVKQVDALVLTAKQKRKAGQGVKTIFSGPAGSGRTVAAQVLASEVGMDLHTVDLGRVISKYIGETEKNLERVFDEAERANVVLLFDEADALFGNRTETQDSDERYATLDLSLLLKLIEDFDGVAILATNSAAKIDKALVGRSDAVITFSTRPSKAHY